ncbi:MAG: hypothetical protein ABI145_13510 [Steroidobacteraceae bacterium]
MNAAQSAPPIPINDTKPIDVEFLGGFRIRAAVFGIAAIFCVGLVQADDYNVYSPYVIASQSEIELRGYHDVDSRPNVGGAAAEISIAHSVNSWWKPEIYIAEYQKDPGSAGRLIGYEFENIFQLTDPGKYWADFGLIAEFERVTIAGSHDAIEVGPLIEKTMGRFAHMVNLIWEKQIGSGASANYGFRYTYSGTYAVSQAFRPGMEFYGRHADNSYQAGPIIAGEWHLAGTKASLEYRVGVVIGLNADAAHQTWIGRLEYEFF